MGKGNGHTWITRKSCEAASNIKRIITKSRIRSPSVGLVKSDITRYWKLKEDINFSIEFTVSPSKNGPTETPGRTTHTCAITV